MIVGMRPWQAMLVTAWFAALEGACQVVEEGETGTEGSSSEASSGSSDESEAEASGTSQATEGSESSGAETSSSGAEISDDTTQAEGPEASTGDEGTTTTGLDADASGSEEDTGSDTGGPPDEAAALCERWNSDRADLDEGEWSGNLGTCEPGDIAANARENALRLVNLYRWLADLPEVTDDASLNEQAQACALIMDANDNLSHEPPPEWTCWSEVGAEAAGRSNISTGPGVMSVDMYMTDWGNATTLGHRRWILSNSAGPIGLGSTSQSSCMYILGGQGDAGAEWTAYPPPGPFPLEAFDLFDFGSPLDETGWSVQSDTIDLESASVQISADGEDLPVMVTPLLQYYGSQYAISIIPQGWVAQAGHRYHVEVTGISAEIVYDVDVVSCGG